MRAYIYIATITLATCLLAGAGDRVPVETRVQVLEAKRQLATPESAEAGIIALALIAHDPTHDVSVRLECMEAILAHHDAAASHLAVADTAETMLRLFPDLPPDRATELRQLAELRLRTAAEALPADDPARFALLARADAHVHADDDARETRRQETAVVTEALYWLYHSQRENGDIQVSYETAKYLTWHYPDSREARWFGIHSYLPRGGYAEIEERLSKGEEDTTAADPPVKPAEPAEPAEPTEP